MVPASEVLATGPNFRDGEQPQTHGGNVSLWTFYFGAGFVSFVTGVSSFGKPSKGPYDNPTAKVPRRWDGPLMAWWRPSGSCKRRWR